MHEIDAVTRPIVDAHFQTPLPTLSIERISLFHAANKGDDPRGRIGISKAAQPSGKFRCLTHLDHDSGSVAYRLHAVKRHSGRHEISAVVAGKLLCHLGTEDS